MAQWLARDPLPAYRPVLTGRGVDPAVLDEIDSKARAAVDRATEEAKAGAEPRLELACTERMERRRQRLAELIFDRTDRCDCDYIP